MVSLLSSQLTTWLCCTTFALQTMPLLCCTALRTTALAVLCCALACYVSVALQLLGARRKCCGWQRGMAWC